MNIAFIISSIILILTFIACMAGASGFWREWGIDHQMRLLVMYVGWPNCLLWGFLLGYTTT